MLYNLDYMQMSVKITFNVLALDYKVTYQISPLHHLTLPSQLHLFVYDNICLILTAYFSTNLICVYTFTL